MVAIVDDSESVRDASLRPGLVARGAVACLFKPFSDTELLEAKKAALG